MRIDNIYTVKYSRILKLFYVVRPKDNTIIRSLGFKTRKEAQFEADKINIKENND